MFIESHKAAASIWGSTDTCWVQKLVMNLISMILAQCSVDGGLNVPKRDGLLGNVPPGDFKNQVT